MIPSISLHYTNILIVGDYFSNNNDAFGRHLFADMVAFIWKDCMCLNLIRAIRDIFYCMKGHLVFSEHSSWPHYEEEKCDIFPQQAYLAPPLRGVGECAIAVAGRADYPYTLWGHCSHQSFIGETRGYSTQFGHSATNRMRPWPSSLLSVWAQARHCCTHTCTWTHTRYTNACKRNDCF